MAIYMAKWQRCVLLRSERKFDGMDALVHQLRQDVEHARQATDA